LADQANLPGQLFSKNFGKVKGLGKKGLQTIRKSLSSCKKEGDPPRMNLKGAKKLLRHEGKTMSEGGDWWQSPTGPSRKWGGEGEIG